MDSERNAGEWLGPEDRPAHGAGWARIEKMVAPVVVTAISLAAVLASVMQPRSESVRSAPAIARSVAGEVRSLPPAAQRQSPPTCADCGIVIAVVPVEDDAAVGNGGFQMHIRMDDGSLRTVEQRGALATGSRVLVAHGSVRVVAKRPGHG